MTNNDILRRLRYTFDLNDKKMISLFGLAGHGVDRQQVSAWLKKEEDPEAMPCTDRDLALFLNGFINDRRGAQEGPQPAPEESLTNNIIMRKLKIALNLKDEEILEILARGDFRLSKSELGAFFRKPDHKHYRQCQNQVLRYFLKGLQLTHRPAAPKKNAATWPAAGKPPLLCLAALLFVLVLPWQGQAQDSESSPLNVFTSLAPVAFVVEAIGGNQVAVQILLPPGRDPHSFSPTPRQVTALSQADIYFTVGMLFERQLMARLTASHHNLHLADCSAGISKRLFDHDHDHHHHQADEGDPHIWLGTRTLARMATNIAATLGRQAPHSHDLFQANLAGFLTRLEELTNELGQRLAPFAGRSFLVFHPSFGYFADSFGLIQEAVEIEGKSPSPRQVADIIKLARAKEIKVIFIQPQFDHRAASRIAQAIDADMLTLDPLHTDVFSNLRDMAEKIATSLIR